MQDVADSIGVKTDSDRQTKVEGVEGQPAAAHSVDHSPAKTMTLPLLDVKVPDFIANDLRRIGHEASGIRQSVLNAAPAAVVNNSTNIIGGVQIAAEMCMMLASVKPANKEELKTPFRTIRKSLASSVSAAFGGQKPEIRNGAKVYAANPWSARSTLAGMSLMALAAVTPDKKDNEEDIESMVKLSSESPARYVLTRLKQSVSLFDGQYKRQHVGLGLLLSGVFSSIAGFTNVEYKTGKRVRNTAHSIGGVITTVAAAQLMLSHDNEQGWSRFGSTMWTRLAFVPFAIKRKFVAGDNWQMYSLGQFGLQMTNTLSATIGGASKNPDGTIVDYKTIREDAQEKYKGLREERKRGNTHSELADEESLPLASQPTAKVSSVAQPEFAMPEQREAMEKAALG